MVAPSNSRNRVVRGCFAGEAFPKLCKVERVECCEGLTGSQGGEKMVDAIPMQGTSNWYEGGKKHMHGCC